MRFLVEKIGQKMHNLKNWYERHERHISSVALLAGFIVDNLTLTRIDLWLDNIILFSYLSLALLGIILINFYKNTVPANRALAYLATYSPLLVQFAFGGLFSGLVIFYVRGAAISTSWPFLLILIGLLVGNEFLRDRYHRLIFQLNVFFIALFSFIIFYLPIMVDRMGAWVFILSGILSLAVMAAVLRLLIFITPLEIERNKRAIVGSIGAVFLLINLLYFLNVVPPLPLSLKQMSVCHSVERTEAGEYVLEREERSWFEELLPGRKIHVPAGGSVYVFSSVFAPTDLETEIIHRWLHYNREAEEWELISTIDYPIIGGRDGGYRGYTLNTGIAPGDWCVEVVSADDRLIGRIEFNVVQVNEEPSLEKIYY